MAWGALRRVGIHVAAGSLAVALAAPVAGASEFELSLNNGRVTNHAHDALITDILAEWGRVGNTSFIDADKLAWETVTLKLIDVPEAQALRTLLRTASGYMAAPCAVMINGVSCFDRIFILASSKSAPRVSTVASRDRAPFTVSPAQQEPRGQLRLLQQQSKDGGDQPQQPGVLQPVYGNVPAPRPGMPMRTADPRQTTVGVPVGAFGSTTPVPESNSTPVATIP